MSESKINSMILDLERLIDKKEPIYSRKFLFTLREIENGKSSFQTLLQKYEDIILKRNEVYLLKENIETNWRSKTVQNYGLKVQVDKLYYDQMYDQSEKEFIFVISLKAKDNTLSTKIFVYLDLSFEVTDEDDQILFINETLKQTISDFLRFYLSKKEHIFLGKCRKWFQEKPWAKINGSSLEQSIQLCELCGF